MVLGLMTGEMSPPGDTQPQAGASLLCHLHGMRKLTRKCIQADKCWICGGDQPVTTLWSWFHSTEHTEGAERSTWGRSRAPGGGVVHLREESCNHPVKKVSSGHSERKNVFLNYYCYYYYYYYYCVCAHTHRHACSKISLSLSLKRTAFRSWFSPSTVGSRDQT